MLFFDMIKLRRMAKDKGVTFEQMADVCFVERSTMQRWLTRQGYLPADVLPALADLLGCGIMDLYSTTAEK